MCGEQQQVFIFPSILKGSPPRVRGTVIIPAGDGVAVRITPACAGNSLTNRDCRHIIKDHPRVCGEQLPEF